VWKLKFGKTRPGQACIKTPERGLDAAVAESKRIRHELDELQKHNELRDLRKRLRRQAKLKGTDTCYPDDEPST
jgi:hypothetical protein